MVLARFCRKPACRRAEDLLKRMVSGEAGPEEREAFTAHLGACPRCSRLLGKTLSIAHSLTTALGDAAERFAPPAKLQLPDRETGGRRRPRVTVLVDFALLLVLGIGLFLLLGTVMLAYRQGARTNETGRVFRAVQEVLWISRIGRELIRQEPSLTLPGVTQRLEGPAGELRSRWPTYPGSDPWGRAYRYALADGVLRVWSCGPDGEDEDGHGDDITLTSRAPSLGRFQKRLSNPPSR